MSKFVYTETLAGTGPLCAAGSAVSAHYHGTLADGSVFDSSVDRGQPLDFTVGVGQVIKGWDEGITQMRVGGKATLTCPPDYAYGARGHPPVIPENATLTFAVELMSCQLRSDL